MSENNYRSISLNSLENLLVELFWKWLIRNVFSGHWSRFRRIVKQESDSYDFNLFLNSSSFGGFLSLCKIHPKSKYGPIRTDRYRRARIGQKSSEFWLRTSELPLYLVSKRSFLTTDKGQGSLHTVVLLEIIWIRLIERQSLSIWIQLWNHLMLLLIFAL